MIIAQCTESFRHKYDYLFKPCLITHNSSVWKSILQCVPPVLNGAFTPPSGYSLIEFLDQIG